MSNEKKVLYHLDDVKMHFPIKKESIFQKEQLFVKAVDGITLDIFEGETLGLVGESGCGKSTLGRVVLQLYTQSAGKVRYSGISLDDYAPAYAQKVIKEFPQTKGMSAQDILAKYNEAARMAGGLLLADDLAAVAAAWQNKLAAVKVASEIAGKLDIVETKLNTIVNRTEDADDAVMGKEDGLKAEQAKLAQSLAEAEIKVATAEKALDDLKAGCKTKAGFAELEAAVDHSVDLARLTKEEMRQLRHDVQMIFQDPYSSLNPRFTVGQLISEACVAHGMFDDKDPLKEEYTKEIMISCGLPHYFIHRYAHQFSGGQRQRIGIARALALRPKFVVCDECVSALDVSIQAQIINLLLDLKKKDNLTYLFISHDLSAVKFISDRVGVMYLGNMMELAESDEIFENPLHPYTNALLEAIPTTDEEANKELQVIEGDIPSPINPPSGCKFHTRCKYCTEECASQIPAWRELRPGHFVACHHPVLKEGVEYNL